MASDIRWNASRTIEAVRKIVDVARAHLDRLGRRGITARSLDDDAATADGAETAVAGQPVRTGVQRGASAAVHEQIAYVARSVSAIRNAIETHFRGRGDILRVFGVGKGHARTADEAYGAADAVLTAAAQFPTETAAAGVQAGDLDGLRTARAGLHDAAGAQGQRSGDRHLGTASTKDRLRDLTRRFDRIEAAAELEFAHEPNVLAQFRACRPHTGAGKKAAQPAAAAAPLTAKK